MLSVKGIFRDGIAQPSEEVEGRDGQNVIITFLDESSGQTSMTEVDKQGWDALARLIAISEVETGIGDLAEEHDYYLYGKPKRSGG
jgi:hypothetical protein